MTAGVAGIFVALTFIAFTELHENPSAGARAAMIMRRFIINTVVINIPIEPHKSTRGSKRLDEPTDRPRRTSHRA